MVDMVAQMDGAVLGPFFVEHFQRQGKNDSTGTSETCRHSTNIWHGFGRTHPHQTGKPSRCITQPNEYYN